MSDGDSIAKQLINEMISLEAEYQRVRTLPPEHPSADAYAKRLAAHKERAIQFARRVQQALNSRYN